MHPSSAGRRPPGFQWAIPPCPHRAPNTNSPPGSPTLLRAHQLSPKKKKKGRRGDGVSTSLGFPAHLFVQSPISQQLQSNPCVSWGGPKGIRPSGGSGTMDSTRKCLIHATFYHGPPGSGSPGRYKTDGEGSCCSWHVHPAWRGPRGIRQCPLKPYRHCNLPPNPCHAIRSGAYRDRLPLPIWVASIMRDGPGICSCPGLLAFLPGTPPLLGKIPIASFPVSSSVSQTLRSPAFHSSAEG